MAADGISSLEPVAGLFLRPDAARQVVTRQAKVCLLKAPGNKYSQCARRNCCSRRPYRAEEAAKHHAMEYAVRETAAEWLLEK